MFFSNETKKSTFFLVVIFFLVMVILFETFFFVGRSFDSAPIFFTPKEDCVDRVVEKKVIQEVEVEKIVEKEVIKEVIKEVVKEEHFEKDVEDLINRIKTISTIREDHRQNAVDQLLEMDGVSEECKTFLEQSKRTNTFTSQINQDWFLYYNFFQNTELANPNTEGRKGFYFDVGAYDPKKLSNTYFFDKCLGWEGICVEIMEDRVEMLKEQRSCKVVHGCVTDRPTEMYITIVNLNEMMTFEKPENEENVTTIQCNTLENILSAEGVEKVDFMSLDIEGLETNAMQVFDTRKFDVDFIAVEKAWTSNCLDFVFADQGYWKIQDVYMDDIYMKGLQFKKPNTWSRERTNFIQTVYKDSTKVRFDNPYFKEDYSQCKYNFDGQYL